MDVDWDKLKERHAKARGEQPKMLTNDLMNAEELARIVPDNVQYDEDGNLVVAENSGIIPLDAVIEYTGVNLAALETIVETNLQTVEEQKRQANLPVHVSTDEMARYPAIIVMAKREQEAMLPETGQMTDGYLIVWRPVNERKYFTTFIGGMVLVRDLKILKCPFQTRLMKRGRTWQFV